MGMDLARKDFSTAPEYFIAGAEIPVGKAVKEAAADIPAHAPVALDSSGKLALIAVTGSGSDKTVSTTGIYGIAPDSIKAGEEGPVYLTGEFFADSLALEKGVTVADVEVPLRNIGIFLK